MADFTHLHLHTGYSYQDGISSLSGIIAKAKETGMSSVAVTDHGNMDCAIRFYKAAKKAGIKPILGCEAYFTREPGIRDQSLTHHLTLLVKNAEGYKNLLHLISEGEKYFYYRPRITPELLKKYSKGLIGMSACLGGEIAKNIIREYDYDKAKAIALEMQEIFDGDFYLEVMRNGFDDQIELNDALERMEDETGILRIPTNDVHYLEPEDAEIRSYISYISKNRDNSDEQEGELWMRSPQEMIDIFGEELCSRTLDIAAKCNVEIQLGKPVFPLYSTPGMTADEEITQRAWEGLKNRGFSGNKQYETRLREELEQITTNKFSTYLLIVADFIRVAREKGIAVGPGRGSAAGSLVCYCLEITDLDPIPYNLLFERFINPERVSLPDVDVDFCERRRPEMIQYMMSRYGAEKVAQIANVSTLQAKMAINDIARAMRLGGHEEDIPLSDVSRLTKEFDLHTVKSDNIIQGFLDAGYLKDWTDKPLFAKLLRLAAKAEGTPRGRSVHAAGVVVADTKITDYAPVFMNKLGLPVTQYDKKDVEEAGLIKFDFLGLKNMTMIQLAIRYIEEAGKGHVDIRKIPLDDKATFELYAKGEMDGVFQMESAGMRKYLSALKPKHFEDLIALIALYRPGPLGSGMTEDFVARSQGKAEVSYFGLDSFLKDILEPTQGVIVYQEQVMQVARAISGFTLGQADILRRAMGKKNPKEMASQRDNFVTGAIKNNVPKEKAEQLFDMIAKFAEYGFNKSHSAAYALISYQTAYLKAHYPVEFMAALMEMEQKNVEKLGYYARICRGKIPILQPDVLKSAKEFIPVKDSILFGLSGLKGIPEKALDDLITAQKRWQKTGAPTSVVGVMLASPNFNAKFLEVMNKAGAFDKLLENGADDRFKVDANAQTILQYAKYIRSKRAKHGDGKQLMLGIEIQDPYANIETKYKGIGLPKDDPKFQDVSRELLSATLQGWSLPDRLRYEREVMGFRISEQHPVDAFANMLPNRSLIADIDEYQDGTKEFIVYVDTCEVRSSNKTGKIFWRGEIEDESGSIPFVVWNDTVEATNKKHTNPDISAFEPGYCYRVKARVQVDNYALSNMESDDEEENRKTPLQMVIQDITQLNSGMSFQQNEGIRRVPVPMNWVLNENHELTPHGKKLAQIIKDLSTSEDSPDVTAVHIILTSQDAPEGGDFEFGKNLSGFVPDKEFDEKFSAWKAETAKTRNKRHGAEFGQEPDVTYHNVSVSGGFVAKTYDSETTHTVPKIGGNPNRNRIPGKPIIIEEDDDSAKMSF